MLQKCLHILKMQSKFMFLGYLPHPKAYSFVKRQIYVFKSKGSLRNKMCSYFVSVRKLGTGPPLPPRLKFAKSVLMFLVILQSICVQYLASQGPSTADVSISHNSTPSTVSKSKHLRYISYQIPTPQW